MGRAAAPSKLASRVFELGLARLGYANVASMADPQRACRAAAYRGRASGMAGFGEAPGWSAWYHEIAAPETPFRMTAASSLRSSIGTIQARARGMG